MSPQPVRIAVIGSGLDARIAALRLLRSGQPVVWLDGGMAAPEEPPLGEPLPAQAPELMGLAAELGQRKTVQRAPAFSVQLLGRTASPLRSSPHDILEAGVRGPIARRRARRLLRWYAPWLDAEAPERGERLDDRSVGDWCRLYLGRRNLDQLMGPCLATHFGLDPEETSRLFLLSLLDPAGRPQLRAGLGIGELERTLDAALERVRRSEPVRRVRGGGRRIELGTGRSIRVAASVVMLPPALALQLAEDLTPAERDMLERIPSLARAQLRVRVPARLAPVGAARWVAGDESGPLAGIVTRPSIDPVAESQRDLVLVARARFAQAAAGRSSQEVAEALLYAADRRMPGLRDAMVGRELWRGQGPKPGVGVGHYRAVARLRAEQDAHPERGLFLAGQYQLGPHAEAAAQAGARTADRVLSWSASRS